MYIICPQTYKVGLKKLKYPTACLLEMSIFKNFFNHGEEMIVRGSRIESIWSLLEWQLRTPKMSLITIGVCTIFSMVLLLSLRCMYLPIACTLMVEITHGRNNLWSNNSGSKQLMVEMTHGRNDSGSK